MESIKSKIYNYLTKAQKSELYAFVNKFVQKHREKSNDEIASLFIEEEVYYLEIANSRHPWIGEFLDDEAFLKDTNLLINDFMKKIALKEKQRPFLEKQKELQKKQRVQLKLNKMSKEPPTIPQIKYFKALCSKYKIDFASFNIDSFSKLDMKVIIGEMIDNNFQKDSILKKLQEIIDNKEN